MYGFPPFSSNAKAAWQAMGEPEYLNERQVRLLEEASRLVNEELSWQYEGRTAYFMVDLPPHAVAALTIELTTQR